MIKIKFQKKIIFWKISTFLGPKMAKNGKNHPKIFFSRFDRNSATDGIWHDHIWRTYEKSTRGTPHRPRRENRSFRENSGSVIFLQISSPDFMPKIRNILQLFKKLEKLTRGAAFRPAAGKPDFSGQFRLCNSSSNIIPQLHAKNQKHPKTRFPDFLNYLNQHGLTNCNVPRDELTFRSFREGTDWNRWVLFGTVWNSLKLFRTVWYCLVLFGTVWYCLEQFRTVWYCLVLFGTV